MKKIVLAAVEPSADAIGGALLAALKTRAPDYIYSGCGGPAMARAGLTSLFPIDRLSVMGFTDVARALPEGFRRANELTRHVVETEADSVVFIDGWAFSRICATRIKRASPNTKLFKLAAPQVWASRPQRVEFVKEYFDGVLTLLPFEPPFFESEGVKASFIGNPNFQQAWKDRGEGGAFRSRHNLGEGPVLAVLLGSREGELRQLGAVFKQAVGLLLETVEDLKIVIPAATSLEKRVRAECASWPGDPLVVSSLEKPDALAAASAALAVSGTISTEVAINNTPMVIAYKVDWLTGIWARRVTITPFGAIINYAAGREIIPEFIQERAKPALIAEALSPLLLSPAARAEQLEAFPSILNELGVDDEPAAAKAAATILEWLS